MHEVAVDTQVLIWALLLDHRLSVKAKSILRSSEHELIFSLVSLWEIAIKIKTGKLNTIGSSVAYIRDEMNAYGMQLLPIRYDHILALESLPHHHGDPFDRLLIAQAAHEGLPILTARPNLRRLRHQDSLVVELRVAWRTR